MQVLHLERTDLTIYEIGVTEGEKNRARVALAITQHSLDTQGIFAFHNYNFVAP